MHDSQKVHLKEIAFNKRVQAKKAYYIEINSLYMFMQGQYDIKQNKEKYPPPPL
jgi:hypothetical protein